METCELCGTLYYENHRCPICSKLYQRDMDENRIPPGIQKKHFTFRLWRSIRIIEEGELAACKNETLRQVILNEIKEKIESEEKRWTDQEQGRRNTPPPNPVEESIKSRKNYTY